MTIKFCPEDGNPLSDELQTSGEIIKIADNIKKDARAGTGSVTKTIVSSGPQSRGRARTGGGGNTTGDRRAPLESSGSPRVDDRSSGAPTKNSFVGTTLDDQYEVLSVIGQGGMSIVYKARHIMMKKVLAVKTLLPHLVLHPHSLERFRQESQAASNLHHPNIVTIHNFGFTAEGQPYLVMDYLEGTSLQALIRRDRYLPVDRACHIFAQIVDALSHAHSHGVIHRDLKPSNILLVEQDGDHHFAKIVDFGIAKLLPQEGSDSLALTQTGELFGSPLYMSPEQCKGEQLDAKSDVYSMGCLMYEALTGKPPLTGDNTLEVLYKHINEVPAPLSTHGVRVPAKMENIIFKCLAKSPAQRYQNMDSLRDDLLELLHERRQSIFERLIGRWELMLLRRKPRSKKDKLIVGIETALLLSVLCIGGAVGLIHMRATESPASKQEITWTEDQYPEPETPTSDWSYREHGLTVGFQKYMENKFENDPDRVQDLMAKLTDFGRDATEHHYFVMSADAYHKAWQISCDYNGEDTVSSFMAEGKYADALREKGDKGAAAVYESMLQHLQPLIHHEDPYSMGLLHSRMAQSYYLAHIYDRAQSAYICALSMLSMPRSALGHHSRYFANPTEDAALVEITTVESHLADCDFALAIADKNKSEATPLLRKAADLYFQAQRRWRQSRGDYNHDETIASLRLAQTYHQLGNEAAAEIEFNSALEHARKVFGSNSAYYGLMLREYSDFLWDRGNYIGSAINRVSSWTILADVKE
ncbi:MAG TPA: serine/threonine-protein kinase [Trichormus sp.]